MYNTYTLALIAIKTDVLTSWSDASDVEWGSFAVWTKHIIVYVGFAVLTQYAQVFWWYCKQIYDVFLEYIYNYMFINTCVVHRVAKGDRNFVQLLTLLRSLYLRQTKGSLGFNLAFISQIKGYDINFIYQ